MIETPSQRIRKARIEAGFRSAMQAAAALRMPYTTYASYENGKRGIDLRIAERLARAFRVDPVWLLTGRREPGRPQGIPVMGKVGAGASVEPVQDGGWAEAIDRIELPDPEHLGVLIVTGDSQLPRYRDGEAILYDMRAVPPQDLVGQYAICDLADGRRMIKIIRRVGDGFLLESHNAEPEIGPELVACYRVVGLLIGHASRFVRPGGLRVRR